MDWVTKISSKEHQLELKQLWKNYLEDGQISDKIRPEVASSWKRCKTANVDPYKTFPFKLTDRKEIQSRLKTNENLIKLSAPIISNLYNFHVINKGSKIFATVCDADGYALLVYSDEENAKPQGSLLYTDWSEKSMGNNPISVSLHENRPAIVIGYEHFCIYPHYYAGAGAPIHNPDGKIIGAISITNKTQGVHLHTFGLATVAAYSIERELKILKTITDLDSAYKHRNSIINSISEGLILINKDLNVTYMNNVMTKQLNDINCNNVINKKIFLFIKDPLFKSLCENRTAITDFVTEISYDSSSIPCTVTYRPLSEFDEGILVINKLSRAKRLAKRMYDTNAMFSFNNIIGENLHFQNTITTAKSFASTDSNILLLGESGTGKDIFAQAIHNHSKRKHGPFIPVNCGAISKNLILSELFGYVEGAFTGAKKGGAIGKFEQANNGTIFLDEIGELPMDLQVSLLRALETNVINRVGSVDFTSINCRVIAATNKNLIEEVRNNTFREDLFFRLNVLSLTLPSLRQRKDDIELLSYHFINKMNIKHEKNIISISTDALKKLTDYKWPGNIRELQNTIERCVALSNSETITLSQLPKHIYQEDTELKQFSINNVKNRKQPVNIAIIEELLETHQWNISKVARILGVSRTTIYRKLKSNT